MPLRNSPAMTQRLFHFYPIRLVFVLGAVVAAVVIVQYRFLIKWDTRFIKANRIGG